MNNTRRGVGGKKRWEEAETEGLRRLIQEQEKSYTQIGLLLNLSRSAISGKVW